MDPRAIHPALPFIAGLCQSLQRIQTTATTLHSALVPTGRINHNRNHKLLAERKKPEGPRQGAAVTSTTENECTAMA